jgi:predicted house-cleaning noncanonical NTP pyrophosphatase (MazG superfamily)
LPVEFSGSLLGHAYYRLRDAGIIVLVPQPKYPRVRGLQRHFKVVRDAIPQNIAAKGERVSFARLASSEALVALIGKLFEEGLELSLAQNDSQKIEELADVLEVVRGLAATIKVDWDNLLQEASKKRATRGGFEQQTVLLETARPMPDQLSSFSMSTDNSKPSIFLRDIGIVVVDGPSASIPFSRLLSATSTTVDIILNGKKISISAAFDGTGIHLLAAEAHRAEEDLEKQLELFDSDPR